MNYTWRRAAKAMLVTSLTTAFAFLASAFSKIVPIKTFGIFAAIIIPMNFILVIVLYPALIIVNEKIIKKLNSKIFGYCRSKKRNEEDIEEDYCEERPQTHRKVTIYKPPTPSLLERFFGGPWNAIIRKIRFVFIIVLFLWGAFAFWRTLKMSPLTNQEQWMRDSHYL